MRGGIPVVVCIVGLFITVFILILGNYIFVQVVPPLTDAVNETMEDGVNKDRALGFISLDFMNKILGSVAIIFCIGIVLSYYLDRSDEGGSYGGGLSYDLSKLR